MSQDEGKDENLANQRSDLAVGLSGIRGSDKVTNEEEGNEDYWAEIDVQRLKVRELRAALQARGLPVKGRKRALQARLQKSVHEEKEEELEYLAMVEAARRAEAALEESGSVYTVGVNRKGQLGLGDNEDRFEFTVVKGLRGKGIMQVAAGGDIAMALAENGNVFTWGGIGTGIAKNRNRNESDIKDHRKLRQEKLKALEPAPQTAIGGVGEDGLNNPRLIEPLQGEGIIRIATGPNHSAAVSDGGDLYMWGDGTRGQLGTGTFSIHVSPMLVESLQDDVVATQVAVGQTHSMVLGAGENDVYSWGFSNSGKLGIGMTERMGAQHPYNKYFPVPVPIPQLQKLTVRLIACSANHSALVANNGIYTWGSGDGGRLGHGDHRDRLEPCLIKDLENHIIIDISLGFWHSAAIIQIPPCFNGGWIYTWGSGYHGQLAQGDKTVCTRPGISQCIVDMHLLFIRISCGPTHCFAMTIDGDMYSWGSNAYGELSREMLYEEDEEREYTPIPGFVEGFNTIVNRVGRGNVISFSCGKHFTIVATSKYLGETEEEKMIREEEEADRAAEEAFYRERDTVGVIEHQESTIINVNGNSCVECEDCPGFEAHIFRPNECKECKHQRSRHTGPKKVDLQNVVEE